MACRRLYSHSRRTIFMTSKSPDIKSAKNTCSTPSNVSSADCGFAKISRADRGFKSYAALEDESLRILYASDTFRTCMLVRGIHRILGGSPSEKLLSLAHAQDIYYKLNRKPKRNTATKSLLWVTFSAS